MPSLLSILLIAAAFIAASALLVFIVRKIRTGRSEEAFAESYAGQWQRAAEAIGMCLDPGRTGSLSPRIMRGMLRGVSVRATWRGDSDADGPDTLIRAAISPPMRLGFELMPEGGGLHRYVEARFGEQDIEVGIEALDHPFVIRGIEAEGVRALCRLPEAQGTIQMLTTHASHCEFLVNDREVRVRVRGVLSDPQRLYSLVDVSAYIASSLALMRSRIPLAPWESDVASSWNSVAKRLGIGFDPNQICLHGSCSGMQMRAWVDRNRGTWCTGIQFTFAHPLTSHLQAFMDGELVGLASLAGLEDLQSGHVEFDDCFTVQGLSAAGARHVLRDIVIEKMMLERSRSIEVALETHRLVIMARGLIGDPTILESRISDAAELARACSGS